MPRTILVRLPGGATGRVRRQYAVRQKLQLLEECNRLRRVENLSLRGAAAAMSTPHTVLVRWTKARPRLIASLGRMKAICEGPVGQLDCIREELLQWIFARHEQGIAVTMPCVVYKASSFPRHQQEDAFKDKGFEARLGAVTCFLAKYDFVYRAKTNKAMRAPVEVYEEATAFMARSRPSLRGPHRDKRWIWNMDQTPVYFSYHRNKTFAKRGIKTVHTQVHVRHLASDMCADVHCGRLFS
jgi:hypothetical protein